MQVFDIFSEVARILDLADDFRVLRRVPDDPICSPRNADEPTAIGAVLDTETTGVKETDAVIEIGFVRFEYGVDSGKILRVIDTFCALQEPFGDLPEEVIKITGITPEMLRDRQIDQLALAEALDPVDIIIAHNAAFDRRVLEREFPAFPTKAWGCSMTDIDWRAEGADGQRLGDTLSLHGLFHSAHRACLDARALLHVLSRRLPVTGETAFARVLKAARDGSVLIVAQGAPFIACPILKSRGYRWSPAEPKAWWRMMNEPDSAAELAWLTDYIYAGVNREPLVAHIAGIDRFLPIERHVGSLMPLSDYLAR